MVRFAWIDRQAGHAYGQGVDMEEKYNAMFAGFECLKDLVYIADMENHELLYCNSAARAALAHQPVEGKEVNTCHWCIQGNDRPCPFCNNATLHANKWMIWKHRDAFNDHEYVLLDSAFELDGRKCRLEIALDGTNVQNFDENTKLLRTMDNHLTDCVRKLVRSEDFENAVDAVLTTVLNFYNGERAYLFDFDWNKQVSHNTHEICAPGITSEIENLRCVPIEYMNVWIDLFHKQDIVVIEDLEKIKDDKNRADEYETLRAQGIHSIIAVPIFLQEQLQGFIGVDNPGQNFVNTDFLVHLSYFIGTEIEKNKTLQKLRYVNHHDPLTGICNRNAYAEMIEKHDRMPHTTTGMAFLDLNGLKYLNDNFGHEYGDAQIKRFAEVMQSFYPKDKIFRISGDEFVIVDLNVCYEEFTSRMERLRTELYDKQNGMAALGYIWDENNTPLQVLQNQAEQLMYAQKQKFYVNEADSVRSVRPRYIKSIVDMLKKDTYLIYLQPKYDFHAKKVFGAEALIRKLNERGQVVYPSEFISALEKEHAVSFIDFFVFEEVCVLLKQWQDQGEPHLSISTNFSRDTIAEIDFCEHIQEILERTNVDPHQLMIEVTESSNSVHIRKLTELMDRLKRLGLRFSLDDMGTEYATMQMLELAELDDAKFDMSLTRRVKHGNRTQKILIHLVQLCHDLGMTCIAEGVETEGQMKAVQETGCDGVQGYYIGKPMPVEEFEKTYINK